MELGGGTGGGMVELKEKKGSQMRRTSGTHSKDIFGAPPTVSNGYPYENHRPRPRRWRSVPFRGGFTATTAA